MDPSSLRERKKARTRTTIAAAALELFLAGGFDAVTLSDVAAAADVSDRTLFRYFADKEELLFGEEHVVRARLEAALASRPAGEPPAAVAAEALLALAALWQDRQAEGRARQAVIEASPALLARERAKHVDHERLLATELAGRGLPEHRARLLARAAVGCFHESVRRWLADADPAQPGLEARGREAFAELAELLNEHAST